METSQELFSSKELLALLEAELVLRQKDLHNVTAKLWTISDSYYKELDPVLRRTKAQEYEFLQKRLEEIRLEIQELEKKIKERNINTKI